jgi:hypothetical protein
MGSVRTMRPDLSALFLQTPEVDRYNQQLLPSRELDPRASQQMFVLRQKCDLDASLFLPLKGKSQEPPASDQCQEVLTSTLCLICSPELIKKKKKNKKQKKEGTNKKKQNVREEFH